MHSTSIMATFILSGHFFYKSRTYTNLLLLLFYYFTQHTCFMLAFSMYVVYSVQFYIIFSLKIIHYSLIQCSTQKFFSAASRYRMLLPTIKLPGVFS